MDMELETRKYRQRKTIRIPVERRSSTSNRQMAVEASSLQHFFKNSLKGLAHLLKPEFCKSVSHADCMMKVEASGDDSSALLIDFLTKVLALSIKQHAIFCRMYVEELSENKLVATLFGSWFDRFDQELKCVIDHSCTIEQKDDFSFRGLIAFDI